MGALVPYLAARGTEFINDLDRDLITLYRTVKHHPEELHRQFAATLDVSSN